jgi:hypothetical protein
MFQLLFDYFIHLFFRDYCTKFKSKSNLINFREVNETNSYELTICNTN